MTNQIERVKLVLNRVSGFLEDEDDAEVLSEYLDAMLDEISEQGLFGTEKQCDPRGDFRGSKWSMWFVSGIDGE